MNPLLDRTKRAVACALMLLLVTSNGTFGAGFLQISGIEGESKDKKHDKWIDVLSMDWGVAKPGQFGRPTGERSRFSDFSVEKLFDKSTPKLNLACAGGERFSSVVFELTRDEGPKPTYLKYELQNVMITSVSPGGSTAGTEIREHVTFTYQKITWTHFVIDPATSATIASTTAGWDVENDVPITGPASASSAVMSLR